MNCIGSLKPPLFSSGGLQWFAYSIWLVQRYSGKPCRGSSILADGEEFQALLVLVRIHTNGPVGGLVSPRLRCVSSSLSRSFRFVPLS